ncbi:F21J9.9 [Salix koriyanagi]|uniref:F21J9.9 n=1 Tax=Salix koriyanagi TaxID=2511006 RepID=A0A9Q0WQ95_9ROSI|nr:F21J9.9 [Salix koriyanagi]
MGEGKASMATIESSQDGDVDFYVSTDFCTFPFYGIDFGWGKPAWVTVPARANKNAIIIMDARDGRGVEAWVTLTEEDMTFF